MKNKFKVKNGCGKKGCSVYILPQGATKEEIERHIKEKAKEKDTTKYV